MCMTHASIEEPAMPPSLRGRAMAGACAATALAAATAAGAPAAPVTVPSLTSLGSLERAYAGAHAAGLLVTLPETFTFDALCKSFVFGQSPRAGASVARGSAVEVRIRCLPGLPVLGESLPSAVVPDFRGRPVAAARAWADQH